MVEFPLVPVSYSQMYIIQRAIEDLGTLQALLTETTGQWMVIPSNATGAVDSGSSVTNAGGMCPGSLPVQL